MFVYKVCVSSDVSINSRRSNFPTWTDSPRNDTNHNRNKTFIVIVLYYVCNSWNLYRCTTHFFTLCSIFFTCIIIITCGVIFLFCSELCSCSARIWVVIWDKLYQRTPWITAASCDPTSDGPSADVGQSVQWIIFIWLFYIIYSYFALWKVSIIY